MKRLIAILILLLLCACVPTPETEAVIVKTEIIPAVSVSSVAPESSDVYQKTFTEGDVTVTFDAEPEMPKCDRIASYALHAAAFSDEQLLDFVHAFFGDEPIYEIGEPTKEEIYPELLAALELLEKVKAHPEAYEAGIDTYKAEAEELQRAYNAAQSADALTPKNAAFVRDETSGAFGCRGDGGREPMATLVVFSEGIADNSLMRYQNPYRYVSESCARSVSPSLEMTAPKVARDNAIRIAKELAKKLCGDALQYAGFERGARVSDTTGWYEQDPNETPLLVLFTRVVDGIQIGFDAHAAATGNEENNFAATLPYERLIIGVDRRGVCFAEWQAPVQVGKVLDEACAILSPADASEKAAMYLRYLYPANTAVAAVSSDGQAMPQNASTSHAVQATEIRIVRIVLGRMQVRTGASALESKLIPVWDFYGSILQTYDNGEAGTICADDTCLLTLDAVSGARIDRALGY